MSAGDTLPLWDDNAHKELTPARVRQRQREAIVALLGEHGPMTPYAIAIAPSVPGPHRPAGDGALPLTLVISLLKELERCGLVECDTSQPRHTWYLKRERGTRHEHEESSDDDIPPF